MKHKISRRDFLKLAGLLPAAYYLPRTNLLPTGAAQSGQQNIIILVCDAWSASNISLYGYPRQTTPFLEKLAEKAIVYHNHYAAGHYTYPGTTGLLTGVLAWNHRGYTQGKPFYEQYRTNNLFGVFDSHHRIVYTHNQIADAVLRRMLPVIDDHKPRQDLYVNSDFWLSKIFGWDYDTASTAWVRLAKKFDDGYANSLFLSNLYSLINIQDQNKILEEYPMGLPSVEGDNYFYPETAIDWIAETTNTLENPYVGYFHLLPPHDPYHTRRDFSGTFKNDGFKPVHKPEHPLTTNVSDQKLDSRRKEYDEYILLVDHEINRLYKTLEENHILDNTWLIVTSDHGEMFERGILGHIQPTFHQPLMHVPLMIFPPGQQERIDVYNPTAAIDLIPTLLHVTGKTIPGWLEGELLPPYNNNPNPDRLIFGMDGRFSDQEGPFTTGTVMLRRGDYKLTYLFGSKNKYKALNGEELYELYNLKKDPEELDNLFETKPDIAQGMLDILLTEMINHGIRKAPDN